MIAVSAYRHLTADLTRALELGPRDFQRKLGEEVEPLGYGAARLRIRERARHLADARPRIGS